MKKKALIKSWGCQMNMYDAARMGDILLSLGYERTDDQTQADLVILNTCHIREKASQKLFSELGRLHEVQQARAAQGDEMMLVVAGCVAQAAAEEIARRAPYVKMIFGPQNYHRLPEMLARAMWEKGAVLETDFPAEPKFDHLPDAEETQGVSAFLSVQEGCDRFCSYCVVPYTRGTEYSRPFSSVKREAENLISHGAREITLLGQNVNAYRDPDTGLSLGGAIRELAKIDGLMRLRYTTSYPRDMDDDLITAHADTPKLMPFLHLPAQSGSNAVLAAMNRKHTAQDYLNLVEKLKKTQPEIALSSDFIVGFPGETEEDFEATLSLVRNVTYAQAFSFKYSRRPGTPAAAMEDQIDEVVKAERLARLQALLREQQAAFNKACEGKILSVLLENPSDRTGFVFGRSPFLQTVRVKGGALLCGQERAVKILKGSPNSCVGELVDEGV